MAIRLKHITKDSAQLTKYPFSPILNNFVRKKIDDMAREYRINGASFLRDNKNKDIVKTPITPNIGQMFFFMYNAITPDLPVWDKFPVSIIISVDKEHFAGLNLHYLHPELRLLLLDELIKIDNTKNVPLTAKLASKSQLLAKVKEDKLYAHCYKRYLRMRQRSPLMRIAPKEWVVVSQMPLQKWAVGNNQKAWEI